MRGEQKKYRGKGASLLRVHFTRILFIFKSEAGGGWMGFGVVKFWLAPILLGAREGLFNYTQRIKGPTISYYEFEGPSLQ